MHKCEKLCKSGNISKVKIEREGFLSLVFFFCKIGIISRAKAKLVFLKGVIFLGFIAGRIHVG